MSDVAETTAAEPTTATEAPVESQATETHTNLTPKERVREMGRKIDAARAETARKAEQARNQHREDGRFAQETTEEPAAETAEAGPVSESEPLEAEGATQEADGGPAEGFVRIEYPEDHPLRLEQGVEYEDVPEGMAMRYKAMLNGTYSRRREVEEATRRAQELETRLARIEAENRFRQERGHEFWTADDQAFYEDAKEKYGEEFAEVYRQGKIQKAEAALREATEGAQFQAVASRVQSQAQEFKADALSGLPLMYPGLTPAEVETAVSMYAMELDNVQQRALARGMSPVEFFQTFGGYNEKDFFAVTKDYIESRPGVIAKRRESSQASEVERNRIKAEAEEAERARRIEASKRHASNPQRNLGGASVPRNVEPEPEHTPASSPSEAKREGKRRFLETFRQSRGIV